MARRDGDPARYEGKGVLGEDDEGWAALTARLGDAIELVGDDNFCTNPAIITTAIARGIANASLIKLNQIGTVTETTVTNGKDNFPSTARSGGSDQPR